jgi:heme-degrading monooxygenase HmoA
METGMPMERRIGYFLRKPRFPVLLDTGTELLALRTAAECQKRVPLLGLAGDPRPVVDAHARGFAFYPDREMITPMILKREWTKAEIVALYHARKRPDAPAYTRSLANRKLEEVVPDIVDLLRAKPAATRAARPKASRAQAAEPDVMIARTWHGRVPLGKAGAYEAYLRRTGLADYRRVAGNRGVYLLRRDEGDVAHFTTLTFWDSVEAIRAFAGPDHERARYYPEDDEYLLERETFVTHHTVVEAGAGGRDDAVSAG